MYPWKYWRESRIVFCGAVLCIAALFVLILRQDAPSGTPRIGMASGFFYVMLNVEAFLLGLLAWSFGSFGLGRDLGEKSGSFLLSRPIRRSSFIWMDWGCGLAQLFLIVVLSNLAVWFQAYRIVAAAGDPLHGYIPLNNSTIRLSSLATITSCAVFLVVALVFSFTYFCTILIKHARGATFGALALAGYMAAAHILQHYWPNIQLPGLVVQEFAQLTTKTGNSLAGISDHLWLWMSIRAVVVLLFPFAAQVFLEKADI
jgi:hypothetical protein